MCIDAPKTSCVPTCDYLSRHRRALGICKGDHYRAAKPSLHSFPTSWAHIFDLYPCATRANRKPKTQASLAKTSSMHPAAMSVEEQTITGAWLLGYLRSCFFWEAT